MRRRVRPLFLFALACLIWQAAAAAATLGDGIPSHRHVRAAANLRLGDRVLAIGMAGTDVFHLQVLLRARGFATAADRVFGPQTRASVMRAQRRYGLAVDGMVGPITLAALRNGAGLPCSSTPATGDAVTRWTPVVGCVLGMLHQS